MFSYDLKPSYSLTDSDIYGLFWTALTSGSIGYGCVTLDAELKDYVEARKHVEKSNGENSEEPEYVVIEDVWTELFKMGKLHYREHDDYDDHTSEAVPVTIDDVYHNLNEMQENEPWILKQFAEHTDDADTHDAFLQCLLLGEIVYG